MASHCTSRKSVLVLILTFLPYLALCQFSIQFTPSTYNPILAEEQPAGTEVVTLGALYRDSFGIAHADGLFALASGGDAHLFTIETPAVLPSDLMTSGVVRTAVVFDRDVPGAQLVFEFDAQYAAPDGTSDTVHVRVTLADVNDNPPVFTQEVFNVFVLEETPGGSSISDIIATDPDLRLTSQVIDEEAEDFGEVEYTVSNGRIIYSLLGGKDSGNFSIDADTGELSLAPATDLDVDVIDLYNVTVLAVDGGMLNDTATVLVHVLDSNDNQPQILYPSGLNLTLPEDTPPGYVILEGINATDADSGINAAIKFLIIDGDTTDSFTIDENLGGIVITSPLDREAGATVNLTVAARDQGIPESLQDTIQVVIQLLDVNDFTPTFTQASYEATVNENSAASTTVVQLEAVDDDEGVNGTVTYSIIQGDVDTFTIDSQTGEITTLRSLDREELEIYELVVEAVDNPDNSSFRLSSDVNVTILVGDRNDNAPIFDQSLYNISILDSVRRFDEIIQVNAADADIGANGQISYDILNAQSSDRFSINEDTGIVFVNRLFNFEDQPVYMYTISAVDSGLFPRDDSAQLVIYIHNVNENPPEFLQRSLNTTIPETTDVGELILTVNATDPDVGEIGEVKYRNVTDFDEAGSFVVNETSGEVYVSSRLDYDYRDHIFFQVEAYDGGFPEPWTDIANITVFLVGENDEAPSIVFPDSFQPSVPENEAPPIEVVTLSDYTFDPDFGLGGEFVFSLFAIYDPFAVNDSFTLNETTGLLTSQRTFDREQQPGGIIVAIETIDFGMHPRSKVTNITIAIEDRNDQQPYFDENVSATVYEFRAPGAEVLQEYRGMDNDIRENARLEYDIASGDDREQFTIDRDTSAIYTTKVLNKTEQKYYNLTIIALDQGEPQMHAFGQVSIEVLDANDQQPIFMQDLYNASLPENSNIGSSILQVNATDLDIGTNAAIEYYLTTTNTTSGRFTIDATTGEIFTNDTFDREQDAVFELTVLAVDNGLFPFPQTGEALVLVYLQDTNDETPFFNQTSYTADVIENAPNGTSVVSVLAFDFDAVFPNNAINYSLVGNRSDEFEIDPKTGDIFVSGVVDWEEGTTVSIEAVATDLGEPPRSSRVEVVIFISDVNDRAPVFLPESLNLTIPENSIVDTEVGYVNATDPDSAGNNSLVSYSIVMDFSNGMFDLNPETGLVTFVKGALNRESRSLYDLLIRASDHGSPQLHTDATLFIIVSDSNDFSPTFDQDTFVGSIMEDAPLGRPILSIHATDADVGSNAELRYSILDSNDSIYFAVNLTTGVISTNSIYDFESITRYVFDVQVSDSGNPPRNDSARVRVDILDSNDLPPVFNQNRYEATLRENLAPGTTVLRVGTSDGDTDLDNTNVEYTLRRSTENMYFNIHPETGVLYTTSYINREENSVFNLTVVANNSAALTPLNREAQIVIDITDLNDMHPTMNLVTEVIVPESTNDGSRIHTLMAVDGDEGVNGAFTYTVIHGNDTLFSLNTTNGEITLNEKLDFETRSLYIFSVMAQDHSNESLANFTSVLVRVSDSNDHRPFFTSDIFKVTVNSNLGAGHVIATLVAFDRDVGSNAALTYEITYNGSPGLFDQESQEGTSIDLIVVSSLTSYAGQNFTLFVMTSDPDFSATAQVDVFIQDGSDPSLPNFVQQLFSVTIPEDEALGKEIFTFSTGLAVNADRFDIESGNPEGLFNITPQGIVHLETSGLDFETQSLYQLSISVANTAGARSYTILDIEVTDVNEHGPVFISDFFFVPLPETTPIGEPFFTVFATDRDASSLASEITYAIVSGDTSTLQVDPQTGELSLIRDLDYESGDVMFSLVVSATNDAVSPQLSSEVTVNVTVLNGNNHVPYFDRSLYNYAIDENTDNETYFGLNIVNVTAFDDDIGSQGEITYGILGDHRYLDFRIDTFTGMIYINEQLDRERQPSYTLEVVASDGGNPNQFAIAIVTVLLHDINDNSPVWDQAQYSASLIENSTVGTVVIQVLADDIDQIDQQVNINGETIFYNRNGYVTYNISDGDPDNYFRINPDTGIVTIASPLDREAYPQYNLTLNATDGPGRFALAYLYITVHDVNDELPLFSENPYAIGLPENAAIGTFVLQVSANDSDLNSEVMYEIAGGNINQTFLLNSTNGIIWTNKTLDREVIDSYSLVLEAIDMGPMSLTGTTTVEITVIDINEFPPVFAEEAFFGEVSENTPSNTFILQLNASDMDFAENATILFTIVSGNDLGLFEVVSESGEIRVAGPLDFEEQREHQLVVMAIDSAPTIETRLSSEVNVTIQIIDVNDNTPEFLNEPYIVVVREDEEAGAIVFNATVIDADSGANAEVEFALEYQGSLEAERNFLIDPQSGVVSLSGSAFLDLDRERTQFYDIIINATDLGIPPLRSATFLRVEVADANDNHPLFLAASFNGSTFENLPSGTMVATVTATDQDIGLNGEITYEFKSLIVSEGDCLSDCAGAEFCLDVFTSGSQLPALPSFPPFTIDNQTGDIFSLEPYDRENISDYIIVVLARDSSENETQLSNTTCVHVSILDQNDETPTFLQSVYNASLSEYTAPGISVAEVLATDDDISTNAEVTYQLLSETGSFTIHPETGVILTLGQYDREEKDLYNVIVQVTDRGEAPLSSTSVVMVTILDENDNKPVFSKAVYSVTIEENLPPNSPVIQVNASDRDTGINAEITYSLIESTPADHFRIEPDTGQIRTTQVLDREYIDMYLLTILGTDIGVPPLNSTTQVSIRVSDTNDLPPVFRSTPYLVPIEENYQPNGPILTVLAEDGDLGTNAEITFTLVEVSPDSTAFQLNSSSGELYLESPIDAEYSLGYNLTVTADNGPAMPEQTAEIVVTIEVLDTNDNQPQFSQLDYVVPILEASELGSEVIRLTATDADSTIENSLLVFEITGGNDTSLFEINPASGVIFVLLVLDRETQPRHVLEVSVVDNGDPTLNDSTTVTVVLQDFNDNDPIFEQSVYLFTVVENQPQLTPIGWIRANDIDLQMVSYYISDNSSEGVFFQLNATSGQLLSLTPYDRETQELYSFVAVATDNGQAIERTAEVSINVTVLDENDVTPEYSRTLYNASWLENTTLGTTLLTVVAFDEDVGRNGSLEFHLLPSNDSSTFSINSTSGEIILEKALDREVQDRFQFTVVATDLGIPRRLNGTAEVRIDVLDNNDNTPILNATEYSSVLQENSEMGTVVAYIGASDIDIDQNAEIHFSLSQDFGATFTIDSESGVISLTGSLDYEITPNYSFFVIAQDGAEVPRMTSAPVLVVVVDLNDNPPVFDSEVYETSIPENTILYTSIFQIPATDSDSTSNGELRYSITSGNLGARFAVNERTGLINLDAYLDREIIDFYTLSLRAVDLGTPQRTATAELEIVVSDINDHSPEFESKVFSILIPENTEIGTAIFTAQARDSDIERNSNLTYNIVGGNNESIFEINPTSGEIRVTKQLNFEVTTSYTLSVSAFDNGLPTALSDTTNLEISVSNVNEYPPLFAQDRYYLNISENTVIGTPIGYFSATDSDAYSQTQILYTLNIQDDSVPFAVDELTGRVYVSKEPFPGEYQLSLEATDSLFVTQVDIFVIVLPVEFPGPLFDPPAFYFELSEASDLNTIVGTLTTSSPTSAFSLVSMDTISERFEVNFDGEITLIGLIDLETTPTYVFNAQFLTETNDPLYTVLTVQVTDYNNFPPVFDSPEYVVTLSELTHVGTTIMILGATDRDLPGDNSEVGITITSGDRDGNFALDPSTGALTVNRMLDYEDRIMFVLTANATNYLASPELFSTAKVFISVTDENDNEPEFTEVFYQVQIPESTSFGSTILNLEASDPDSGTNSELVFSISHLDIPYSFTINQSSGSIITNTTFDLGDLSLSHEISVMVVDRGNPIPRSDITTVFVTVTLDNIYAPDFSEPGGYSVEIPETLPIGSAVVETSATDSDSSLPFPVTYSIIAGDPEGKFEMDPSTGLIVVASRLDFLEQAIYNLTVEAEDFGNPPKSTAVQINITIEDVNNHDPQFQLDAYQVSILENITVGSLVLSVPATDPDTSSLTYVLTENAYENGEPLFRINFTTAAVYTIAPIDREFAGQLEILVSAIDSGYSVQRSKSVPVVFVVEDLNDTPPEFSQSNYSLSVLRSLSEGQSVGTVTAFDRDLIGQSLEYSITDDRSGGLFQVDPVSGAVTISARIPEAGPDIYEVTLTASDGVFTTDVPLYMELTSVGQFCEGGFCTSVLPVNCTFDIFPFIECNPHCYVDDYELSPERELCLSFSCLDLSIVPCVAIGSCIPSNEACAGVCPEGMSVCPTTNICYFLSFTSTCDDSNVTCLINQTLVQDRNGDRHCNISTNLPPNGTSCVGEGSIYCQELDICSDLSAPYLCQVCPSGLSECPNTGECVPDVALCCGLEEYFCDVLSQCLAITERCELPNVAPTVETELFYLASLDFEASYSDNGHVIGLFLSNSSRPAVDSQGEEISIAIVEVSDIPSSYGEWQYATCSDLPSESYGGCSNVSSPWVRISGTSEANALVLPNLARIRFVRRSILLEGSVWLRAKLWDGNIDGYISASSDLVRTAEPHSASTIPYSPTGGFSENTVLLATLVYPLIVPPVFNSEASLQMSAIEEDIVFVDNRGNTLADVVISVITPDLEVLPEDEIEGFPAAPLGSDYQSYETLLSSVIREDYFGQVQTVNPTRRERQLAQDSGQLTGVAVGPIENNATVGRWQVSYTGDDRQFLFLDSILTRDDQILLLNVTARVRFVPEDDFCGEATILFRAWDGFRNSSLAEQADSVYVVTTIASLSEYNVNEPEIARIAIQCIPDKPVLLQDRIQLDPIPYRISYRYERLFTSLVHMDVDSFRVERERFSDFLQLVLREDVNVRRLSPAKDESTYVSFSVDGDGLSYEDVWQLISERRDALTELGFEILELSQDASYGPGASCPSDEPQHHHGVQVNAFLSRFSSDSDNDYLGLAVVGINSNADQGNWQYHRNTWNSTEPFNPNSSVWVSFPPGITVTTALLLHGNDRIRFVPNPDFFWLNTSTGPNPVPSIEAKAWDNSLYSLDQKPKDEISLVNINTDPFTDTLQSLVQPVGLFSDSVVAIEAARYGCDGVVNSGLVDDACCVCGGSGSSCSGCDGQVGSNDVFDACDVCAGDSSSCLGCDFIPFSNVGLGGCAECVSDISVRTGDAQKEQVYSQASFADCSGACYGTALFDDCTVCSGGESSHEYNSDIDCASVCFGNATTDECGDCTGPGTDLTYDQNMDCSGVCGGPFAADSCEVCQLPDQDGNVFENRDCAGECFGDASLDSCGVCYGGTTGILASSTVDTCGVCNGDNSTCIGCDGNVNSGKTIDSCGNCGGNDCGCFQVDSIRPSRGPRTGATEVTVDGAGFFLNDTSGLGFSFDRDSENCGAPFRYPSTDETIPVTCLFQASSEQQLQTFSYAVNQSTITCITEPTTSFETYIPEFTVRVRVAGGPFSNPVTFYYDDYSAIDVSRLSPDNAEINQASTAVRFTGTNFINTSEIACLMYEFSACISGSMPVESPLKIPAEFHSDKEVSCSLPEAEVPCRVIVRLTLDGQESGILDSSAIDFQFTYLFSSPRVNSIHFSDDLSSLLIQFDRQVELVNSTGISCMSVFREDTLLLIGGSNASCYWSNNNQEEITVSLPSDAMVTINSPVTFKEGVILTQDEFYSYATNTTAFVDPSVNAVQPVAVLNGPRSIPACGTATFTAAFSLYPGYSGFEYYWSVFVLDSSTENYDIILEYLNELSLDSTSITLDADWFAPDLDYYLELYVVNSIGIQSESETLLLTKDVEPTLTVSVIGASDRVLYPEEDLIVETQVSAPDCAPLGQFEFNWQLYTITDERRFILSEVDLSDVPTQSPNIFIPAGKFTQSSRYVLELIASVEGDAETMVSLSVAVETASVKAVIHGGHRSVSINRTLVLDARDSFLNLELLTATYVWSCNVIGSFEPCYNQSESIPTPLAFPQEAFVTIPASLFASAQAYNTTLALTQGDDVSHASTTIEITASEPPIVEILPLFTIPLSSQSLRLEGLVYSSLPTESVHWESLDLPGQSFVDITSANVASSQTSYPNSQDLSSISSIEEYTSIPLDASVAVGEVSRTNLLLNPSVLVPGLTYTFQLTATNAKGRGFAQISVTPDPSPHSAVLSVEPRSGIALETRFTISVSGARDSANDTPLLYQFGYFFVNESELESGRDILWLSGIQSSNYLTTLLPGGREMGDSSLNVVARVFDRKSGYVDVVAEVNMQPNQLVDVDFYSTFIEGISTRLGDSQDWSGALSSLSALQTDIDHNSEIAQPASLKEESLVIFLDVFNNHLPQTDTHYALAASLLNQLTNDGTVTSALRTQTTQVMMEMVQWFKTETTLKMTNVEAPTQNDQGEPLQLVSNYRRSSSKPLSPSIAHDLLTSWGNLLDPKPPMDASTAQSFVQGVETISSTFCQQSALGEDGITVSSSRAEVSVKIAKPVGGFSISDSFVDFGGLVSDTYMSQACTEDNIPCAESCFQGTRFSSDFFADEDTEFLKLTTAAQEKISAEIEGSDPTALELFSNITSMTISLPSQNGFLEVKNLNSPFKVLISTYHPLPSTESIPLCLHRAVGGTEGFSNFEWQLDTTTPPPKTMVGSGEYFICEYTHLSEFAIGLLPPPVITMPPIIVTSSISSSSTIISSTPALSSTPVTTEEPTVAPPGVASSGGGIAPAAIAVPFILIIVVAVVVTLVVIFLVWKKKQRKRRKVVPGEAGPSRTAEEQARLVKAGPLTPDEARIPMKIIQLLENGERTVVGTMNVLPSIRLRELRHETSEHFDVFKNKPFYFLTRQLCDIEPATEQQQFVSLVYGEAPGSPIFIREITATNEQTKLHFCTCGKAAQFECSNCSSQGYCSPECQLGHWNAQHQKECGRLSEKRRRSEVLLRRQSTVVSSGAPSQDQRPRRVTIATPSEAQAALSPTTPTDWKSFLSSSKAFQPPPLNIKRSISSGAAQPIQMVSSASSPPKRSLSLQTSPRTTLGQLAASQSQSTAPRAATVEELEKRPLVHAAVSAESHLSPRTQLPPLSKFPSGPRIAGVAASVPLTAFMPSSQPPASAQSPAPLNQSFGRQTEGNYTPVQTPLSAKQPFFTPRNPRQMYTSVPYSPASRPLTVNSIEDLALSMSMGTSRHLRDIRNEPLLESDEDDYESTSESETDSQARITPGSRAQDMRSPSSHPGSRPPSLAVRKKRGTSRMDSQASSGSSSSESSGSETDSSSSGEDSRSPRRKPLGKSGTLSAGSPSHQATPKPTEGSKDAMKEASTGLQDTQ